jgi:hypothetical protein
VGILEGLGSRAHPAGSCHGTRGAGEGPSRGAGRRQAGAATRWRWCHGGAAGVSEARRLTLEEGPAFRARLARPGTLAEARPSREAHGPRAVDPQAAAESPRAAPGIRAPCPVAA